MTLRSNIKRMNIEENPLFKKKADLPASMTFQSMVFYLFDIGCIADNRVTSKLIKREIEFHN